MSVKLMSLRDVPNDEAEEIRELLHQHRIDYYETPASHWGISAATIWLQDDEQQDEAKALLEQYQQKHSQRMQNEYQQQRERGEHHRFIDHIRENPLQVSGLLILAGMIAYFSTVPFIELGQ